MNTSLTTHPGSMPVVQPPPGPRTRRALTQRYGEAVVREFEIRLEAYMTSERLRQLQHCEMEALTSAAFLDRWALTLANGDPFLMDALGFDLQMARQRRSRILDQLVTTYQQGR